MPCRSSKHDLHDCIWIVISFRDLSAVSDTLRRMHLVFHWKISMLVVVVCIYYHAFVTPLDVKPQKERYTPDYSIYHNLTSIENTLQTLYLTKSHILTRYEPVYYSKEKRNQHVMKISSGDRKDKVKILLSFGEHAREFLPVETLFYLIENLESSKVDLTKLELYVIALANPDGRFIVEKTRNYCWRGTMTGVDLNRNFNWEFGGKGSSDNNNDEEYRGPFVFSGRKV